MNFIKTNIRLTLQLVILFIVLVSFFITLSKYMYESDIELYKRVQSSDLQVHIDMVQAQLEEQAEVIFDTTLNQQKMREIMYHASQSDDRAVINALREELYALFKDDYRYMQTRDVRQLHFHLPNSVSFLRFHRPSRFGDSLQGVRYGIDYLNKVKEPIACFEEGKIFNGFRNIFPIFYEKTFVGSVEISYPFTALQKRLLPSEEASYLFFMKNEVIEQNVFNSEHSNYKQSEFEDYSYDKKTLNPNMYLDLNTLFSLNKELATHIDTKLEENKLFSIRCSKEIVQNKNVIATFVPIRNLKKEAVAYIVSYHNATIVDSYSKRMRLLLMANIIIALLIVLLIGVISVVVKQKQQHILRLALHDNLTGIYNRHGLKTMVSQHLKAFQREHFDLSVIFFDIDFFKKVNDTYGHDIGDTVLQEVVNIVRLNIREIDIFGRFGGEEFVIYLLHANGDMATTIAEKLRTIIAAHTFETVEHISCSFGVTQMRRHENNEVLLKRADMLLYDAKEQGRNCVVSDTDASK